MELNAELNVNELFDLSNVFQSRILDVCIARNDLAYINSLMNQNSDDSHFRMAFLFRQQIAMIREAVYLISLLYSKHSEQLKEFNNFEQISGKYEELSPYVDDFKCETGTIMKEFLMPVRNMISHYKDDEKNPQYTNVAEEEILSTITLYDEIRYENCHGRLYTFADNVFYRSAMMKWKEYRMLDSTDFDSIFVDFVLRYREIVVKTITFLDAIFDGYSDKYLDVEQTDDGYRIVKKNI